MEKMKRSRYVARKCYVCGDTTGKCGVSHTQQWKNHGKTIDEKIYSRLTRTKAEKEAVYEFSGNITLVMK